MPRRGNKETKAESKLKADGACTRVVRHAPATGDVEQAQPAARQEESKAETLSSGSAEVDEQATRHEYAETGQEHEEKKCDAVEEKSAANSSPRWLMDVSVSVIVCVTVCDMCVCCVSCVCVVV